MARYSRRRRRRNPTDFFGTNYDRPTRARDIFLGSSEILPSGPAPEIDPILGASGQSGGVVNSIVDGVRQVVDDFGNLVTPAVSAVEDFVGPVLPSGSFYTRGGRTHLRKPFLRTLSDGLPTVRHGGRPRGSHNRHKKPHMRFDLQIGRKVGRRTRQRLLKLGAPNIHRRRGRGVTMIVGANPLGGGDLMSLVGAAVGAGAGFVVAQRVVPSFVGKVLPSAASGLIGAAVGTAGGLAISRMLVGRVSPKAARAMALGSVAALGVALVGTLIKLAPASVTAPLGLSGLRGIGRMNDYLQLSGPVPPQVFAGGMNGMRGMGDYVDFGNKTDGQIAQAASAAVTEWTPSPTEQF